MSAVPLTEEQEILANKLRELVGAFSGNTTEYLDQVADTAHELHMSLVKSGHPPRHRRNMLENREVEPTERKFYWHLHPAEDLLAFIDDENANDDPVDTTIGSSFEMRVFTRRWGHDDRYTLKRTEQGWNVDSGIYKGVCNKEGGPTLFQALRHDGVQYPHQLPLFLEYLWNEARDSGLKEDQVQEAIHEIGVWISVTERSVPRGIFERLV